MIFAVLFCTKKINIHAALYVCCYRICLYQYSLLHCVAAGEALSLQQKRLWECQSSGESMWKTVRWICVHHSWVRPWGHDSRSEQRVTTKEQQIQLRQNLTNPLLKWSSDKDADWMGSCVASWRFSGPDTLHTFLISVIVLKEKCLTGYAYLVIKKNHFTTFVFCFIVDRFLRSAQEFLVSTQ